MRPPVQMVLWPERGEGAFVVAVGVQVSAVGSYRPPVFRYEPLYPPQTTMRPPVQITLWPERGEGAFVVVVGVQVSVAGSYWPPELKYEPPPHTITRLPVQTAL